MRKSQSAPSLTSLAFVGGKSVSSAIKIPSTSRISPIASAAHSVQSLQSVHSVQSPSLLMQPPIEHESRQSSQLDESMLFVSKVPLTQVYQCYNRGAPAAPDLKDSDTDLAICMATPHDPVEEVYPSPLRTPERFEDIRTIMSRYQVWWDRMRRGRVKSYN